MFNKPKIIVGGIPQISNFLEKSNNFSMVLSVATLSEFISSIKKVPVTSPQEVIFLFSDLIVQDYSMDLRQALSILTKAGYKVVIATFTVAGHELKLSNTLLNEINVPFTTNDLLTLLKTLGYNTIEINEAWGKSQFYTLEGKVVLQELVEDPGNRPLNTLNVKSSNNWVPPKVNNDNLSNNNLNEINKGTESNKIDAINKNSKKPSFTTIDKLVGVDENSDIISGNGVSTSPDSYPLKNIPQTNTPYSNQNNSKLYHTENINQINLPNQNAGNPALLNNPFDPNKLTPDTESQVPSFPSQYTPPSFPLPNQNPINPQYLEKKDFLPPLQNPVFPTPSQNPVFPTPSQNPVFPAPSQNPVFPAPSQNPVFPINAPNPIFSPPGQNPAFPPPIQNPNGSNPLQNSNYELSNQRENQSLNTGWAPPRGFDSLNPDGQGSYLGSPLPRNNSLNYTNRRGFVISVGVPKGGVGKSTLTVNLAAFLGLKLRKLGKTVCIVDANFQQSDLGKYLNAITPNISYLRKNANLLTPERINEALVPFSKYNLSGLLGPENPTEATPKLYDGAFYTSVLNLLREKFDYIIIDCPVAERYLNIYSEFILKESNYLLVPVTPNSAAVMSTYQWLKETVTPPLSMGGANFNTHNIGVVLNMAMDDVDFNEEDVRNELKEWAFLGSFYHSKEWVRSGNTHELIAGKNYHDINAQFASVLEKVTGEQTLMEGVVSIKEAKGGILSKFKRGR